MYLPAQLKIQGQLVRLATCIFIASLFTIAEGLKGPKDPWLHKWGNKRWYIQQWILFSLRKEENSDLCLSLDKPWWHYAKWNRPVLRGQIQWFHSYEVRRVVKFIEAESKSVGGRGKGGVNVSGGESFGFTRWKSSADGWWWWLHNHVNILNATERYTTFKNG